VCISNAMNVGHPSNLARLVDAMGLDGRERAAAQERGHGRMRRHHASASTTPNPRAIKKAWAEHKLLLEPHGAVGWAGLLRYLDELRPR